MSIDHGGPGVIGPSSLRALRWLASPVILIAACGRTGARASGPGGGSIPAQLAGNWNIASPTLTTTRAARSNDDSCGHTGGTTCKDVAPATYGWPVRPDGAGGPERLLKNVEGDWEGPYTFKMGA
jgi:hypothetical protein